MRTKQNGRSDIQRLRIAIQSTWSDAERERRRRIAARRQRALLRVLLPCANGTAPAA